MKTVIAIVLVALLSVLWLRGGLFQEPAGTAYAAARLEFGASSWREIDRSETVILTKRLPDFFRSLETKGWRYTDRMGAGHVFENGDRGVIVTCRLYSTRYTICKRPEVLG